MSLASPRLATVIIPAHNEVAVIGRTLSALLAQSLPGEFEVLVVANACSDGTESLVRGLRHPDVTCLSIPEASKAAALNAGDRVASSSRRIFLDADTTISTATARELANALGDPSVLAAGPTVHIDPSDRPWSVRAYYRVWTGLPFLRANYIGSGCYALSPGGRQHFTSFPPVIADDQFVNSLFSNGEKRRVTGAVRVRPPRTLRAIVHRSVRVKLGNQQLAASGLRGHPVPGPGTRQHLRGLVCMPTSWPALLVFVTVQTRVAFAARAARRRGDVAAWRRDDSSRR